MNNMVDKAKEACHELAAIKQRYLNELLAFEEKATSLDICDTWKYLKEVKEYDNAQREEAKKVSKVAVDFVLIPYTRGNLIKELEREIRNLRSV